jgi:hypothetical protein
VRGCAVPAAWRSCKRPSSPSGPARTGRTGRARPPTAGADAHEFFSGPPEGQVSFANWPIYIDKAKDPQTGERYIPTLRKFEEETGISVTYKEVIQDNPSFSASSSRSSRPARRRS